MSLDPENPYSRAVTVRYAVKMRPPPMFISPQPSLGERLLRRAIAHEVRAMRLRDLAKLVVEPTGISVCGLGPVSTKTAAGLRCEKSTC